MAINKQSEEMLKRILDQINTVREDQQKAAEKEKFDDVLLTVSEVSKVMKTNTNYVYELIKAGHLQVLKLGNFKIRKVTLDAFLEKYEGYDLTDPFDVKKL